ncbi:MAG: AhpC/TSA family protein [Candidatus Scalindua sp.]|nr:AhpC/TSA family protein [Candidatus Scalindua sp.]MBT5305656.1 AhpC/TSA family protein [Candidatus Scalindua sp.]MBT6048867.1 AhpC/TSA family protein [Candidatus Scalindua sp.]MBT6229874.1 AhpC/TSA family protein [Candidatus Scalindua sp.]MBT6561490.1 AhpC/TSA family protein [Candidatus Scalindua sp.]
MSRIIVQLLFLFPILFVGCVSTNKFNDDTPPSFRNGVKAFMDNRSGSEIDEKDKSIMTKSARDLEISMPEPGLKVGAAAPDFLLSNAFGEKVKLSEQLKEGPVVLSFYRGAWCPFCNIELNVLQKSLPLFEKYNASLIAVTPQQPDKSKEQLEKAEYTFEVLSDLDDNVMKSYNLYFEVSQELHELYKNQFNFDITDYNGKNRLGLPVPGTFVIDQDGIIKAAYAKTDYKKRMEPEDIIKALKVIHDADRRVKNN